MNIEIDSEKFVLKMDNGKDIIISSENWLYVNPGQIERIENCECKSTKVVGNIQIELEFKGQITHRYIVDASKFNIQGREQQNG